MAQLIMLEIKRLLRDKKVLYFLVFLSIFASLSIPKIDSVYSVVNINDSTGAPDIYWITTVTFIISNVLMLFTGFYIFRGFIRKDLNNGKSQDIYLSSVSIAKYIFQKYLSLIIVYILSLSINIIIIFVLNLSINKSIHIDLLYIMNVVLYIQLPFYVLTCTYITVFDLVPFLSTAFGGVIYFFISLFHISNVWELEGVDITGLKILINTIRGYFKNSRFEITIFSNHSVGNYFIFEGIKFSDKYILTQYMFTFMILVTLILTVFIYSKFFKQIELSNITHKSTTITSEVTLKQNDNNFLYHIILQLNNNFIRLVFFEMYILLRNKKRILIAYFSIIILAILTDDYNLKFSYLSLFPILMLNTFSEYKNKVKGSAYSNIKITILGNNYKQIFITVVTLLVSIMILPIIIINATKLNYALITCNILGIVIFSVFITLTIYIFPKAFDISYILFWYIAIFQKIVFIDIFALNKDTVAYNQVLLNLVYICALLIMSLISAGVSKGKILKRRSINV